MKFSEAIRWVKLWNSCFGREALIPLDDAPYTFLCYGEVGVADLMVMRGHAPSTYPLLHWNRRFHHIIPPVLLSPPQIPAGLSGFLRIPEDSPGFLRIPAGLHYNFGDFELEKRNFCQVLRIPEDYMTFIHL